MVIQGLVCKNQFRCTYIGVKLKCLFVLHRIMAVDHTVTHHMALGIWILMSPLETVGVKVRISDVVVEHFNVSKFINLLESQESEMLLI